MFFFLDHILVNLLLKTKIYLKKNLVKTLLAVANVDRT